MSDYISPELKIKINDLCNQISDVNNLDDDISDELQTHMEDKLMKYLKGDEKLTEDDAFLLVREHFGNPEHVKQLFGEILGSGTQRSLTRRIFAVMAATMVVELLLTFRHTLPSTLYYLENIVVSTVKTSHIISQINFSPFYYLSGIIVFVSISLILWFILNRWQKRLAGGHRLWFERTGPLFFICILLCLVLLQTVSPILLKASYMGQTLESNPDSIFATKPAHSFYYSKPLTNFTMNYPYFRRIQSYNSFPPLIYLTFMLLIWFWWCDMPQRRIRSLMYALGGWIMYFGILPLFEPSTLFFNRIGTTNNTVIRFSWIYSNFVHYPFSDLIRSMFSHFAFFLVFGVFMLGLYIVLTQYRLLETRTAKVIKLCIMT